MPLGWKVCILLDRDPFLSLAYPVMTHPLPLADN